MKERKKEERREERRKKVENREEKKEENKEERMKVRKKEKKRKQIQFIYIPLSPSAPGGQIPCTGHPEFIQRIDGDNYRNQN